MGGNSLQIWGFVDGIVCPIARPVEEQQHYFSGHKGYHGIKYQSIVIPGGLISSLYGPELGPNGDWKVRQDCGLEGAFGQVFHEQEQQQKRKILNFWHMLLHMEFWAHLPYK